MKELDLYESLRRAQQQHKTAVDAYGMAVDATADAMIAYRKSLGDVIKTLKEQGHSVSLIRDIAGGMTATLKGDLVRAEGKQRQAQMLVDQAELAIQSIKFLQRSYGVADQQ